jgi:C4-dicarboxylate-binding protein DctP
MRQIKLVLLSLAAVLLAVAPALAAPVVIKCSHVVAVDTPTGQAAEYFKKLVEERSKGDITDEVYPNSSLYGDREELEALTMNSIQMVAPSFSKFTSFVPQLELFDLPFLFNDTAHLHKVLNGEVGQQLLGMVGKKGWVGLGYWDNGFKQMSANKPLIKPEDAAGLKFRIMSSKVLEAQFQALNANPQVMPFSEVYSGLQQKVVDACENPLSNFYTQKFFEVQSDLTLTNHGYLGYMVVTNKIFWNKLSEPQRALLTQAMKEASEYANKLALEMDVKYMNEIKASGKTKVHELTKEQRQPWKAKLMPIYPKFYDKIGKELIDASLAAGN